MDALFDASRLYPQREQFAQDAYIARGWLDSEQQRFLVTQARHWAASPAGIRQPRMVGGGKMSVWNIGVGLHWSAHGYSSTAIDSTGHPVPHIPSWVHTLSQRCLEDVWKSGPLPQPFRADAIAVNYYPPGSQMGMHRDAHEKISMPIISLSVGASCIFRFGGTSSKSDPTRDIPVESGDVIIFGGHNRFAYHGVPKLLSPQGPQGCGLEQGRLNFTIRHTGLTDTDLVR